MGFKVLPLMALSSVVSAVVLAVSPAVAQVDPEILREGAGSRRDAVTAMELKPLDRAVWDSFAAWTNGDAVTETDTIGKVVVFYTWSSFLNSSLQPMSALSRLVKQHGDDLVVIGVHHPEGWDEAEAKATRRRAAFPIAHDADGRFRELMKVDQDPDLYIVDRAGQLRYADVSTASVMTAVEKLLAESAGDAASTQDRMAAASAKEAIANRRTRLLRQELELSELREVTFPKPSEEAYKDAKWPRMWTSDSLQSARSGRLKPREKDEARKIALPADEKWDPSPPTGLDGRLRLIYFMTVEQGAASGDWGAFYDQVSALQRAHSLDLVVMGAFVEIGDRRDNNRSRDDDAAEREKRRIERLHRTYDRVVERREFNHPTIDLVEDQALLNSVIQGSGRRSSRNDEYVLPYYALISSDGMLRWHGMPIWRDDEFRAALQRMLDVDPGVQARRKAEQEMISATVRERTAGSSDGQAANP